MIKTLIEEQAARAGFSLKQPFYKDPGVFEKETQRIFFHQWLCVGHGSSIPGPGDYFLFEFLGESVIIIRTEEGEIRALYNVCRHRGSKICLEQAGNKKRLTCPYHGWSYNLDGALVGAANMDECFDKASFPLHGCHVHVMEGLVFLNFADGSPPPVEPVKDGMLPFLRLHGLGKAKIAHVIHYPIPANWKLVLENFFECYHCSAGHPQYTRLHDFVRAKVVGAKRSDCDYEELVREWETNNNRQDITLRMYRPGAQFESFLEYEHDYYFTDAIRIPLTRGVKTATEDGQPVSRLMGEFTEHDGGETILVFSPFATLFAYSDYACIFQFLPIDRENTNIVLTWLVDERAIKDRDYDLNRLTWLWDTTNKQDAKLICDNQSGVNSRKYRPGPYADSEPTTKNFVRWYLRQLGQGAADTTSNPIRQIA